MHRLLIGLLLFNLNSAFAGIYRDFYLDQVRPIFESRCIACHACYDSPCSLKLTSFEGVERGVKPFDPYAVRLTEVRPDRLFEDGKNVHDWRAKGFTSVLPAYTAQTSQARRESSLLYQAVKWGNYFKGAHEEDYEKRSASKCETEADDLADLSDSDAKSVAMPFGLPALSQEQFQTLQTWIDLGAPGPTSRAERVLKNSSNPAVVKTFEDFLNNPNPKYQWTARYLYEHLYLGHILIEEIPGEFYQLVRSRTAAPAEIDIIATDFPYDDPGRPFFYRLRKLHESLVHKTHIVKRWNLGSLDKLKAQFIDPAWGPIPVLNFQKKNPFESFGFIPAAIRSQWMLDNAKLMIDFFTRGPVCNGSTATSVVRDHFWVFFMDPSFDPTARDSFYRLEDERGMRVAKLLEMPALDDDRKFEGHYRKRVNRFEEIWARELKTTYPFGVPKESLWNGSGQDKNAVLTVMRHSVNVTVHFGAIGGMPKTLWVLSYATFERIYYDLVASFNVYGGVKHKTNTRKYMDNLRREGEDLFLSFLPLEQRRFLRGVWYDGSHSLFAKDEFKELYFDHDAGLYDANKESFVEDIKTWVYSNEIWGASDPINYRQGRDAVERKLSQISRVEGVGRYFKDVSYLIVREENKRPRYFTLIKNKDHHTMNKIWGEGYTRNPEGDHFVIFESLQLSYPNQIFEVEGPTELNQFIYRTAVMDEDEEYEELVNLFGVKKRDANFWDIYGEINNFFDQLYPVESAPFDLNLYGVNSAAEL